MLCNISFLSIPGFQYPAPICHGQCLNHLALGIYLSGNNNFNCLFNDVSNVPFATLFIPYLANLESV